ncbi:uncharacterized protein C9orf57 homolog [Equus przewalskii]|uniref:Uncharacterized protein n=3 Tax=Equus TaxID=9789 RepID=A0A9L0TMJ0_HORSE|nr:PREDICTED: uncharacterized protein C9orf57 homolog [Equus przewalskii]XP_044612766.1 uncharacterized protein C9orf57 homolog [Equus asinus]XP_044612767.1 uncharacterized protein C9orf57 homolog [Equus asinus]
MRGIAFGGVFILFWLLRDAGCLICRYCNLSVPFHGCLLDFGTCIAKPGQHCIKEVHIKGGIQWYSVKGCTENTTVCFKRVMKSSEIHTTHCCHRPLCNF